MALRLKVSVVSGVSPGHCASAIPAERGLESKLWESSLPWWVLTSSLTISLFCFHPELSKYSFQDSVQGQLKVMLAKTGQKGKSVSCFQAGSPSINVSIMTFRRFVSDRKMGKHQETGNRAAALFSPYLPGFLQMNSWARELLRASARQAWGCRSNSSLGAAFPLSLLAQKL